MKAMPCHCAAPNAMPAPAGRLRSATALLPATGLFLQHDLVIARGGADMHAEQTERLGLFARLQQLRSEEHTSELQSLMRISYAVFCLKKKKQEYKYKK